MKKRFQRILAGMLAIVMVLTSFVFDWGNATEAEAASDTSTKNIVEGEVYSDIDFTNSKVTDLDEYFIASQGPKGSDGTEADSVASHWEIGEEDASVSENVAEGGNLEMPNVMEFLINSAGFQMTYLTDDIKDSSQNYLMTNYSSVAELEEGKEEYVTVTFPSNAYYEVEQIKLYPSLNKSNYAGFPVEFEVNAWDGTKWVTVATQTEEDGYDLTTSGCWSKDITPIVCNAIEIKVSKLSASGDKNSSGEPMYALALAEIEAWGAKTAATYLGTVDMAVPSWAAPSLPKENLVDGDPSTYTTTAYLSESEGETVVTETGSVTLTFANGAYKIDKLVLSPRLKNGTVIGFPKTFTIDVWNGSEWIEEVAGKENHTGTAEPLVLDITPTVCSKIRLDVTVLGESDNAGQYCLQLSEFEAWGEKVEYLKPFTTFSDGNITMLTPKDAVVENFRAEIEMLNYDSSKTRYGLFFGQENPGSVPGATYVTAFSTVAGCVFADAWTKTNSEGLVLGGIKAGTAKYAEENYATYVDVTSGTGFTPASGAYVRNTFAIKDFSTTIDDITTHTLNIEVIEGVLKIWWSGFENAAWTVELADGYTGGYVSLFSQGADQGGIKSFKLQEYVEYANCNVDFTKTELSTLDETFIASEGTTDDDSTRVTGTVSEYWQKGTDKESVNAARTGTVEMDIMDFLLQLGGYEATIINDGLTDQYTSTDPYSESNSIVPEDSEKPAEVTITFEQNNYYEINQVQVYWRDSRGCPIDFKIKAYNGSEWVTVKSVTDNSYTGAPCVLDFEPIKCNAVKLVATKLRTDQNDGSGTSYCLQLRELEAYGTACVNAANGGTASMATMSGFSASGLIDGNLSGLVTTNYYSAAEVTDDSAAAAVTFAKNAYYEISQVQVYWRDSRGCPEEFNVQVLNEGKWTTVEEIKEHAYSSNPWSVHIEPTRCNGVRIVPTKLRTDKIGNTGSTFSLQLCELQAWGEKVDYLTTKTAYADGKTTLLTLKDVQVENFKAEIKLLHANSNTTRYGLYFGQSAPDVTSGARVARLNQNQGAILVDGVVGSTAQYVEDDALNYVTNPDALGSFNYNNAYAYNKGVINGFSTANDDGNIHTLNVEVIDGVMKVWWTGYEKAAWTVELTEDYQGGYVSLYSSGADVGGFQSFKLQEITDRDVNVNVGMHIEPAGDYTVVSMSGDLAGSILKSSDIEGSLKFDKSKFEYCEAILDVNHENDNRDAVFAATNGSLPLSLTSCKAGTIVKIYFKNLTDDLDYTGLSLDVDSISRANGKSATAVVSENVTHDYTGDTKGVADKQIDIRDLIHASVNDKAPADVREALVGIGDPKVDALFGEELADVYVNVAASDIGTGTESQPFNSMDIAYRRVKNGGTIHIVDTYGITAENNSIGVNGKAVTLTGGALDLSGETIVQIAGPVTLDGITVNTGSNVIYANGNKFVVNSDVSFSGTVFAIFGGSKGSDVVLSSTHVELYSGDYQYIYGGSEYGTIQNDTTLIVGGTVNTGIEDILDHGKSTTHNIFGGSSNGVVKGNTNVIIKDSAMTCIAYGGGNGSASKVEGICKLTIQGGSVMGYYGGSYGGEVVATEVVMTGGTAEQLYGGSWDANVNGSTKVTWSGGEINRRIYGGCYNDSSAKYTVTGTTTLNVGGTANFSHDNSKPDYIISAGSMFTSSDNTEETSTLNMTADIYSEYQTYIDDYLSALTGKYGYSDNINDNWVQ